MRIAQKRHNLEKQVCLERSLRQGPLKRHTRRSCRGGPGTQMVKEY